jgi:hypothetical protein
MFGTLILSARAFGKENDANTAAVTIPRISRLVAWALIVRIGSRYFRAFAK